MLLRILRRALTFWGGAWIFAGWLGYLGTLSERHSGSLEGFQYTIAAHGYMGVGLLCVIAALLMMVVERQPQR